MAEIVIHVARLYPHTPAGNLHLIRSAGRRDDNAFFRGAHLPDALVLVENAVHFRDVIEVADDVRGSDRLPDFHVAGENLLDETDVAALMAPGLMHKVGIQRHAGEPGARFAVLLELVGADHTFGNLALSMLVKKLAVWREILQELRGRDHALIAEVNLVERVSLVVLEMAGQVDAKDEMIDVVGRGDGFAAQEPALAGFEDQRLFPERTSFVAVVPLGEAERHLDGQEIFAANDDGIELLGLRADLRAFDVMMRQVAVVFGFAGVVVDFPAGAHQEVHDVQAEAEIVGAGLFVDQAALGGATDVALLVDPGLKGVRFDLNIGVGLLDLDRGLGLADKGRQYDEPSSIHRSSSINPGHRSLTYWSLYHDATVQGEDWTPLPISTIARSLRLKPARCADKNEMCLGQPLHRRISVRKRQETKHSLSSHWPSHPCTAKRRNHSLALVRDEGLSRTRRAFCNSAVKARTVDCGGKQSRIAQPIMPNLPGEQKEMANVRPDGEDTTGRAPENVKALHQQRDWLLVTLSCIGDAVITTGAEGRITFLNPVAESLTGWTQEAVGQPLDGVFRIINEESRQPIEIPTVQALREGRTIKLASHSLLVAKDGTERSISDSAAPIRNDKEEVAGVVLVFRDISERRTTERALATALVYADDIIATLREPFVVLNVDLRVKTANRSFYDSFKVTKEETENCLVYELGNCQWDIPALRKLLDEVLARNQSVHDFEVVHTFPTLGRKTMLLNARPFPPDSEHPELILLAVEDVSALRERADELAEVNRHKDEFLATLAHELRNPLAPIRNAVQYLGMDGLTEMDVKSGRDVISRQVTVMVRLIDDLLDVSRISRNKLDIRKQRVALASILESAVESSRPLIHECGHELTIRLPSEPVDLNADPIRLAQVFSNLLNNAAKYTKRGGQIWLTADREGSDAVVSVRDNGIGIPGDMLARIFEMFTQVDSSLERSQGGLGIGLTLVRRLLDLHDGTIEAHSNGLDQGSDFLIRLPLIPPPQEAPPKSDGAKVTSLRNCRILVVDDNMDSADSLGMLLRLKGNQIRTAHDGLEAVEAAETFRPELVLLDIGLPKLNGYQVAQRIRQQPWSRDVILVALTGWGQDEDRRRSQEAGFDFHIVKPVELPAIEELLAKPIKSQANP